MYANSNHQLRMDVYTSPELADMVMCYGEARGNGRRALHMYQQQFQNRNHPHHVMFARLRDDGSFRPRRIGGRPLRHPFSIDDYTELKGKEELTDSRLIHVEAELPRLFRIPRMPPRVTRIVAGLWQLCNLGTRGQDGIVRARAGPRPTSRLLASRPHAEAEVDDHPTRIEVSCG
ncbi:hypothetical protein ANN_22865 [Periplaneta americana]|uniref:DUF4817 domain-containing protein n=1 Tax=Periplaneta americana TaxID=6978 RepID=A0ABQ8SLG8_PERAM|nr:hypothetical protein ANN_22865 [Periplaneta americana]